jgi:hypothetical protein
VKRARQFPTDKQLRGACPELWAWYDSRYPKPQQPRRSLLMLEFVRRFSRLAMLVRSSRVWIGPPPELVDPSDTLLQRVRIAKVVLNLRQKSNALLELGSDLDELLTYLDRKPPTRQDERSLFEFLERQGLRALAIYDLDLTGFFCTR